MNSTRIYAIFLRYWYLQLGNPQRFTQLLVWSTFDLFLWGFVTKYLNGMTGAVNFTTLLLGALLFWQLITRMQQGFITVFLEDSWSRNFLNMFASPITAIEYVAGISITCISTSAIAISFGALIAFLCFGLVLPYASLQLVLLGLSLAIFALALGIISTCIVLRFGPSAEWFAWPVPAVMQPLVGVFYPIAVLPYWAQLVAWCLPPSYVFEGYRAIVNGQTYAASSVAISLVLSLVYVVFAMLIFTKTYHWALKTGAIARYGSESF